MDGRSHFAQVAHDAPRQRDGINARAVVNDHPIVASENANGPKNIDGSRQRDAIASEFAKIVQL